MAGPYDGVPAFRYRYDSLGNELFHEDLVNGIEYFFVYDSLGRTVRMRSSDGAELEIGYDDRNRTDRFVSLADGTGTELQYTYGNAEDGQMADAVYGVGDGKDLDTITYDRYGRTASRKLLLTEPASVSYTYLKGANGGDTLLQETMTVNGTTYGYAYDCHGNLTSVTENGTEILRYTYDFLDELVRSDDRTEGKSHAWSYDAGGNRTEERVYPYTTGTLGEPEKTISYGYGDEKWKDKLTDYNGQTITYDAIGNPISYRDGMTFAWQHGRELKSLTAGGKTTSYTYDEDGYRMTKTDAEGTTRYYPERDHPADPEEGERAAGFLLRCRRPASGLQGERNGLLLPPEPPGRHRRDLNRRGKTGGKLPV